MIVHCAMQSQQCYSSMKLMARINYILMRWWYPFLLDQLDWVGFELDFYNSSLLKQTTKCRYVAPLWLMNANQYLFLFLHDADLEKQIIPFYSLWPDQGFNPQSIKLEASTLTLSPLTRFSADEQWQFHMYKSIYHIHVFSNPIHLLLIIWILRKVNKNTFDLYLWREP